MEAAATSAGSASSTASATSGDGRGGGSDFLNLSSIGSGSGGMGMFGNQQGSSAGGGDLLLGAGSGFDSIGNGYGNDGSSGSTMPGGGSGFDLSDFPSLGGGGPAGSVSGGSNGLAAALRQQQLLAQQQQQQQQQQLISGSGGSKSSNLYRLAMTGSANPAGNFNVASEDFPALGSSAISGGSGSDGHRDNPGGSAGPFASGPSVTRASSSGSSVGVFGGTELDSGSNPDAGGPLLSGGGLGNLSSLQSSLDTSSLLGQTPSMPSSSPGSAPSSALGSSGGSVLSGDYGLLGLLGVIRMSDAERNALALGSDLTSLGMNLNSNDQLYSTFASPWSENPTSREPQYQLPMCYYMQPPALKTGHLSKFQLETLFYIFYALPKDVLQAYAAQELYSREWRFHAESKLWLKRPGPNDGIPNSSGDQWIYFDIQSWDRKLFSGNQNVTSGLLSEDDVRVKFPNS